MDIGEELERITAEPLDNPVPDETPTNPDREPAPELEPLVPA